MTRILYLSQWFYPENSRRGLQVMAGLVQRGHQAEALTGFPNYPLGRLYDGYRLRPYTRDEVDGLRVHRVFLIPSHSRSSLTRVANYLSFAASALVFLLVRGRRYDAVYVYHPPITVGLAAALSGLVTRRPYVLEVQDLWPDSVAASKMAGTSILTRLLSPVCDFVYRRAAFVLAQSQAMTDRLVARGVAPSRADTVYNWADEEYARPRGIYPLAHLRFDGRFNLVFGGSFGRVQGLETLIEAAHLAARQVPRLQLTLIGDGVERDRLAALVDLLGSDHVQLLPAVPQREIGDVFHAADVLVAHLVDAPVFEVTVPSKLQFYLAMGKPVLLGGQGEAARIIRESGAGVVTTPGSVEEMARAMVDLATMSSASLDLMGTRARDAYRRHYSRDAAIARIGTAVERALAAVPGGGSTDG